MSAAIDIVAFLVVIAILVTVHEYGHFWVARRCGVAVQRFSIGFGPVLLRRQGRDGVEYAMSAIPLGGYVKMLDEREGEVPSHQLHRAFNRQPLWQRNAVIAAGPLVNFLFAVLVFWALFLMGDTVLRPLIGDVTPQSPAAEAGFQPGDEITAVGGSVVDGWNDVLKQLLSQGPGNPSLPVAVRTQEGRNVTRELDVTAIGPMGSQRDVVSALGWQPKRPPRPAVIGDVLDDSAAARAGLAAEDRIVKAGDNAIDGWQALVTAIERHRGDTMPLVVERDGSLRQVRVAVPDQGKIGIQSKPPEPGVLDQYQRKVQYSVLGALGRGATETWDHARLMVTVLAKMVTGQASLRNISGPVHIADYAGDSAQLGLKPFLNLMALISISLGIINLLPIPVLDGGQILFNACEWLLRRPLPESAQAIGTQIGLALIAMIMGLALYNDLLRALGAE